MSTAVVTNAAAPARKRAAFRPGEFRIIPSFEANAWMVAFAQSIPGKVTLLSCFGILLWYATNLHYPNPRWKLQIPFLILMTALPQCRRALLSISAVFWTSAIWGPWAEHPAPVQAAIVFVIAAILFRSAGRFRNSILARRPVATLLTGFTLLVMTASYLPHGALHYAIWTFLPVAGAYLWFIAYSLIDVRSKNADPFMRQAGTYQPFWGSTNTPFVKGAAYLRRIEAKSSEQLAIAQLKGMKLLLWSVALDLFLTYAYMPLVHGYLNVPYYDFVFHLSVQRAHFPCYQAWTSLISDFFEKMIELAILGHRIVAICRMAGFAALRNTYKPLTSKSIAEFWNRYYFYFKELLVDCFFYPTFMRYFKRSGRWRLFAATFAAAGFGNAFFHFFRDLNYIEQLGFWKALVGFQSYLFYTIVLATGIGISQIRERKSAAAGWLRRELGPLVCVCGFFCILRVFDYTYVRYPLSESFRFLAHLLGLIS